MAVVRIVPDVSCPDPLQVRHFYKNLLGLETLMDMGWIITVGSEQTQTVQISFASQGGCGVPTPDLSIEVDNLDEIYAQMISASVSIEYPLTLEPWGIRRFFVRDPAGKLVNILSHAQ